MLDYELAHAAAALKTGKTVMLRQLCAKLRDVIARRDFVGGHDAQQIFEDWIRYLTEVKLWGLDEPLFPATKVINGRDHAFEAGGLDSRHWTNASPIRAIFKTAFSKAGLPYFPPHSFRKTLVRLGQEVCIGPEDFKIWSQNLGHEEVLTTFRSYGQVEPERQAKVIKTLGRRNSTNISRSELPKLIEKFLSQNNLN